MITMRINWMGFVGYLSCVLSGDDNLGFYMLVGMLSTNRIMMADISLRPSRKIERKAWI